MTDPVHTLSRRTSGLPIRERSPYITYVLVAVNVSVLLLTRLQGEGLQDWILHRLAQDRLEVRRGEWWRLLTAIFVHDGWAHLFLNMLLLFFVGGTVESILGAWRFVTLYLVCGLSGALFFQAFASGKIGIGASGAIVGVFGAYLVAWASATSQSRRTAVWRFLCWAVFLLLADFVYAYVMERASGVLVASSAHAGGFVAGALLGRAFAIGSREPLPGRAGRLTALAALAILLTAVGAHAFLQEVNPRWPELEEIQKFERTRASGSPEAAVSAWKALSIDGHSKRESGYLLWDWLMSEGRHVLAASVLEDLIASAGGEYDARVRRKEQAPELANELAWYLAFQGTDLPRALSLANHAVQENEIRIGGLSGFLGGNRLAGTCINTRGWILLRIGEREMAIKDLRYAAELSPVGPHFLYLAIAHEKLGNTREAREAGRRAGEAGDLSPYEKLLLAELEEDIGGF